MGAQKSDQPEVPDALKGLTKFAQSTLIRTYLGDPIWKYNDHTSGRPWKELIGRTGGLDKLLEEPGFGMDLTVDPSAGELEAAESALRTFGKDSRFSAILSSLGDIAVGTDQDFDTALRAVQRREFERGSADIRENLGNIGSAFSEGVARGISDYRAQLGEKLAVDSFNLRNQDRFSRINAAQAYTGVAGAGFGELLRTGGVLRGIEEANLNRVYQDILTRKVQIPLAFAQAAFGGSSSVQLWQPTYGPSGAASGAAAGATIGGAAAGAEAGGLSGPWGALIGALVGAGLGYASQ
jgi:hypothetical protein